MVSYTEKKKLLEELWNKSDGKCAHCGKTLNRKDCVIDHIFPKKYGGSDHVDNLRLLCKGCNVVIADRPPLRESEFQQYIRQFLLQDSRFENVRTDVKKEMANGEKAYFDIMFSRKNHGKEEQYIIEVKNLTVATNYGITSAISQLKKYQSFQPNAHIILAVPTILAEEYRRLVCEAGFTLWDSETFRWDVPDTVLPICAASDQYDELIYRLKQCQPGFDNWQVYQKLVGEVLTSLFCPPLDPVSEQNSDANLANRRDFIVPNYAECGYWPYLRQRYRADFIVVDAKNSAKGIVKDDILQVAHYLKEKGVGLFGLIFSRCGIDESAEKHLQDIWRNENKMLIILNDSDVEQMLLNKQRGNDPCQIIIEKIQEFRLRI